MNDPALTRQQLLASHREPNPEFDKWRKANMPPELWRNFDLTACRIGFEAAQQHIEAPVPELKGSYPVVLYFACEADCEEFIAAMQGVQPSLVARKLT